MVAHSTDGGGGLAGPGPFFHLVLVGRWPPGESSSKTTDGSGPLAFFQLERDAFGTSPGGGRCRRDGPWCTRWKPLCACSTPTLLSPGAPHCVLQAYSPLGRGIQNMGQDPVVSDILPANTAKIPDRRLSGIWSSGDSPLPPSAPHPNGSGPTKIFSSSLRSMRPTWTNYPN